MLIPAGRRTIYDDHCGMARLSRKRGLRRNEKLRKVDSFSCSVVGPVPVFDSFVLASLELHALVVRSIVSNQQGRVLHVVSTGCWIDEMVRANQWSFYRSFIAS